MSKLGYPQRLQFERYLDCKKRSKKKHEIDMYNRGLLTSDEKLVRFMLENSSIVQSTVERSYGKVSDAIHIMCKQLCPGQWCTRSHCPEHSSRHAYNCQKTKPSVCKLYKAYIDKKEKRNYEESLKLATV